MRQFYLLKYGEGVKYGLYYIENVYITPNFTMDEGKFVNITATVVT